MVHTRWRLPAAFVLFATAAMAVSPGSLTFTYAIGGVIPTPQSLSVPGTGTYSASAASPGNWLTVLTTTGRLPAVVDVAVNALGLSPGVYTGAVSLSYQNAAPQTIPVTLVVTLGVITPPDNSTEALSVSPTSLTFNYPSGGAIPPSQSLSVTGSVNPITLIAPSASQWLSVSLLTATSPATCAVSVNPSGLAPGTYAGAIIVVSNPGGASESQRVNVTLTVTAAPPDTLHLLSIVNGASFLASPLAPGEIISIFGSGLGPANGATRQITPSNIVDTLLAGTRVFIGGKPAPILFTQSDQVNTIVPFSAAGKSTVELQFEYQGVKTTAAIFAVADAAPAIFTLGGTGSGQGAILNQDTSINLPLNQASRGSIAVLYATGAGLMTPSSEDGAIAGTNLAHPLLPVSVTVDGQNAPVIYAGSAPGQVAGVVQVNFRVPALSHTGSVELVLTVGRFHSQSGVTVSVR